MTYDTMTHFLATQIFARFSRTTLLALLVFFGGVCGAFGSDTAIQLQTSVARMKDWLGTSSQAEGWRRYLLLNALETQAALGDRADIQALNEVLSRFQTGAPGLEHPGFQDVRRDIEEHVAHLAKVKVGDLS